MAVDGIGNVRDDAGSPLAHNVFMGVATSGDAIAIIIERKVFV